MGRRIQVMDLHLKHDARDGVLYLWVNGRLVAEVAVGAVATREALVAEVVRARRLEWLAREVLDLPRQVARVADLADHVHAKPAARQAAFVRGFLAGLEGKTVEHPLGPGVPPLAPEHTLSYKAGYDTGAVVGGNVRKLQELEAASAAGSPWHSPPGG
jgi:hypothetical protein